MAFESASPEEKKLLRLALFLIRNGTANTVRTQPSHWIKQQFKWLSEMEGIDLHEGKENNGTNDSR